MVVAALYDVHGNLPALEAVLDELERVRPDVILFGGDVAAGPMPRETIERLRRVPEARFVRGNGDRMLVEGTEEGLAAWASEQLDDDDRAFLSSFPLTLVLDDVLYCHATPYDDEPFVTVLTPDDVARGIIGDVDQSIVVIGHTHTQFDRRLGDVRLVNAGSVGMPNEDAPGAYWLLVRDGEPELRHTAYDLDAAAERIRASGWPPAEKWISENLVSVPTGAEAAAFFESQRR